MIAGRRAVIQRSSTVQPPRPAGTHVLLEVIHTHGWSPARIFAAKLTHDTFCVGSLSTCIVRGTRCRAIVSFNASEANISGKLLQRQRHGKRWGRLGGLRCDENIGRKDRKKLLQFGHIERDRVPTGLDTSLYWCL